MDKAVEYLSLSSEKAANLHALEEAKDYFDEAMKLLDTMPETEVNRQRRISLLVNQWLVFFLRLKLPEYYDLLTRYESLVIGLGNPKLLGVYYIRLGNCEWSFGKFNQAIQTLTKGAELCEASGSIGDAGYAYLLVEWSHLYNGDYDLAIAFKEDALRRIEQRIHPRWYIWAVSGASWAYSKLGRWDEAVDEGLEALRVAKEVSDNSLISFSGWITSLPYTLKGDLARAVEYGEMAVQKAPTPADKVWAQGPLARALCRAGEQKKGIEILDLTVSILQSGRFMPAALPHTTWLGEGYCLAGEYDKARQTLEEFLEVAEHCGARYYLGSTHRLLGKISLETNPAQIEEPLAEPHFKKSIALLREIKAENELALAYGDYGRLHKQRGNIGKAREYLTKALEILDRLGTLTEPEIVRKELADLPES
jgi:tetratricopeptide (TPR) repeat protein